MPILRLRPSFRRLALTLAAAQLLAYASAPIIEAVTERAPGSASIESGHSKTCIPLHAPETCMACQLLVLTAETPVATLRLVDRLEQLPISDRGLAVRAPRPPPGPNLSRAPPTSLA